MSFISTDFLLFLLLAVFSYHLLPDRHKWKHLLVFSLFFYACTGLRHLFLLLVLSLVDFLAALRIDRSSTTAGKHRILALGVGLNVAVLVVFKYSGFLLATIDATLGRLGILPTIPAPDILLPLGISYYIFKKISYLIDVYRGNDPPVKSLGRFYLYVFYFPEIIAGPIDRAGRLIPQFRQTDGFDRDGLVRGGQQLVWGLFKKLVIADRLAKTVTVVYENPSAYPGPTLLLATLFFSIQIYCDFSGYSDMAIGIGRMLGHRLADNFNRPYFAVSVADFWNRWHISLSTWLRDYLFLPISFALSRRIKSARVWRLRTEVFVYLTAAFLTMVLCGLWHGSGTTFLVWGALHGLFLGVSFLTRRSRRRLKKRLGIRKASRFNHALQVTLTFITVTFAWIFFRAASLADGMTVVGRLFSGYDGLLSSGGLKSALIVGDASTEFFLSLLGILVLMIFETLQPRIGISRTFRRIPLALRWMILYTGILFILVFGVHDVEVFIYELF